MIRKQLYIEERQERLLKERARRYRVTEADLIRRAIDQGLGTPARASVDLDAWRRIEQFIARHRRRRGARRRRRWTRDSLYDR